MKSIKTIKEKCYDCSICELVCSEAHTGAYRPMVSRIKAPSSTTDAKGPLTCRQCKKPQCVKVCPTGALSIKEWIYFDETLCNRCGNCVEACPFDAIWQVEEKILKCDLCGGSPKCTGACPGEALIFHSY